MKGYINIVTTIFILLVAFAAMYCTSTDYEYETYIRITEEEIKEEIDPRTFETEEDLYTNMTYDFFNVYNKNDHIVGWMNIPNIGYFPVMAYSDNSFYLNHNEYDRKFGNGSVFMNTGSQYTFDDIALLHGHHLKSGRLFGSLCKYEDEKFFQTNDLILVFDGKNFYYYRPFSVYLIKDGEEFLKQKGLSSSERKEYLLQTYNRSMVQMADGMEPNLESDILFLQTCDYTFKDARLIVAAYRVKTIAYDPAIHGPF